MADLCKDGGPQSDSDYENVLLDMNTMKILFSVMMIIGSAGSTIPQHIKLWKTKTSAGVSFWWLFIGTVGLFSAIMNAVILKNPQEKACLALGYAKCLPSLLSLIQLLGLFVFSFPIFVWCLYFIDPNLPARERKIAYILFGVLLSFFVVVSVITASIIGVKGGCSNEAIRFAEFLGIFAGVLSVLHWSPQIYATYKRKGAGSFSIIMLIMQCPGAFLVVFFLAVISKERPTTYLSFLCSAIQMAVLVVLLLYYQFKERRASKKVALLEPDENDTDLLLDGNEDADL